MDIHKPKPIHSWREFLKEVGIIVLGVSIALTAEQIVESFHWKSKVGEVEASLRKELGDDDGPQALERIRISRCVNAELDVLQKALLEARDHGAALAPVKLTIPEFHTWDADAWHAAMTSDVATHMQTNRMYNWGSPYALIADMDQFALREANIWAGLRVIETTPAHPSAEQTAALLQMIAEARGADGMMKGLSQTFLKYAALAGVRMTDAQRLQLLPRDRSHWPACVLPS